MQHSLGDAADDQPLQTAEAAGADDDQVHAGLRGGGDDLVRRTPHHDRPLDVGERDERVEGADLRARGHRRGEDVGAEQTARVDHRLAAVHPEASRHRRNGVVGDGQDDQLDLVEEGLGLGKRPGALDQRPEPLAASGVTAGNGTPQERIRRAFLLAYGRPPRQPEVQLGLTFLASAGEGAGLTAWEQYAQVLLAANEFMYVD